ncbi:MAG: hypothetical protein KGZ81_02725 [Flavobacteriales bacterium]|nr:hypothetical protein [Flavobacteriales bacterium]
MIKHFTVLFLMLCISCTIRKNEFNQKRYPISRFKIKPIENTAFYELVDTSSIYVLINIYNFSNLEVKIPNAIKFYKNGRVGMFKNSFDDLSSLNPKKAEMGLYKLQKNKLEMEFITYSAQAGYFSIKSNIIIKGDTIFRNNGDFEYTYLKHPLPSEFLVYKPDW